MYNALNINLVERLGMVLTTLVMCDVAGDSPLQDGDVACMQGDSTSAVSWANKCGKTKDPGAAALMRVLGMLELRSGWCLSAHRRAGCDHIVAGGIFRLPLTLTPSRTNATLPSPEWQEVQLGARGGITCSAMLQECSRQADFNLDFGHTCKRVENVGSMAEGPKQKTM